LKEIEQNDYNLSVTLYTMSDEEGEHINVGKEWGELAKIRKDLTEIEKVIEGHLRETGLDVEETVP
jgi:type I restriction-modification system DNA methylase subunit